jgi:hypothetical protein
MIRHCSLGTLPVERNQDMRVKRCVYGLKDSGYHWYRMASSYVVDELGFKKSAVCEATNVESRRRCS